jgi:Zn-finger protein
MVIDFFIIIKYDEQDTCSHYLNVISFCIMMTEQLKERAARGEFNLCPMCWMPLYANSARGTEDFSWGLVQYVFKGKPAFSVQADGYKRERAVLAFGVSDLHENGKSNCEDCHFIHKSANASTQRFGDIWDIELDSAMNVLIDKSNDLPDFLAQIEYQEGRKFLWITECRSGIMEWGLGFRFTLQWQSVR